MDEKPVPSKQDTLEKDFEKKRKLRYFYFYEGELSFETPLHIGASDVVIETDAPLLRDAGGLMYLPGTSVIGPLRSRAEELFKDEYDLINNIFGFHEKNRGVMSRLLAEDAYPKDKFLRTTIRDGVAMDRSLGSAKQEAKYDLEISPMGLRFDLKLRLGIRDGDEIEKMRFVVETILEEFREKKIRIGGGKSRGLGRCRFDYQARVLDFGAEGREDLIKYLMDRDTQCLPAPKILQRVDIQPQDMDEDEIRILLEVEQSPFMIKHGRDDSEYDAVFTRVFDINGHEIDYVPGSSLKGVFRSRAEKIMRTLGGKTCMTVDQTGCTARIKERVKTKKDKFKEYDENRYREIRKHSCPVCRLFGNGYLAGRIGFDDAVFRGGVTKKQHDSVAIDRFTGGAAHLFNAYPVVAAEAEIRIHVKEPSNLDKALISFLLRDLMEGFPPLCFGHGKAKGYGLLKCSEINGRPAGKDTLAGLFETPPEFDRWWKEENDA